MSRKQPERMTPTTNTKPALLASSAAAARRAAVLQSPTPTWTSVRPSNFGYLGRQVQTIT